MLKFSRNKLISIEKKDEHSLLVHGLLDDDIYGLQIDLTLKIPELEISSIYGKWNRWTTPECPRAVPFLQEAVGLRMGDGFTQKVRKVVGNKACRHYANLLLECCYTAREAARSFQWEAAKKDNPKLTFKEFILGATKAGSGSSAMSSLSRPSPPFRKGSVIREPRSDRATGGMVIDLHVHTSPASPCSSAPVDALIEEAKRIGLDGICLTDHHYVWAPLDLDDLRQKHGFLVLGGNEITTDQGDMVVFGFHEQIKGIIRLEELREVVLKAEGFIVAAHPFRGFVTFGVGHLGLTPERAMDRPLFKSVDAVEVLNSKVTREENSFASKVAAGLGLPTTGGSDAHEVSEVGLYATRFFQDIGDETEFIEALRHGNYAPIAFRKEKVPE